MVVVTIFTKEGCAESTATRLDLESCQVPFQEIVLEPHEAQQVPEIYFDNDPVLGGVDELLNILQKWEVVTGKDGLPDIVPIKSGESEIHEYYQASSFAEEEKAGVRSPENLSPPCHANNSTYDAYDNVNHGASNPNDRRRSRKNEQPYDLQTNRTQGENRRGSNRHYENLYHQSGDRDNLRPDDRRLLFQEDEASSISSDYYHEQQQQQQQHSPHVRQNGGSQNGSPELGHPSGPYQYQSRDSYLNQQPPDVYHQEHLYKRDPYQQHQQSLYFDQQAQHGRHPQAQPNQQQHRQQYPGEHQDHYRQPSQQRQQHRNHLPSRGTPPSFLQRPNRRSGLKADQYQRHSFHGRTLREQSEADDATITSPNNDDDISISSQQSFLQESMISKSRREKSRAYANSRPRSFHGHGNRRKVMEREHSFHGRTRHKDFEINDSASVTNPNDDDSSVCSRQSYSSRQSVSSAAGRGSRTPRTTPPSSTSPSSSQPSIRGVGMKRESSLRAGSLRDEMKREVSMRGSLHLHGSGGSLYGSMNNLSDDSEISDQGDVDIIKQNSNAKKECDDLSFSQNDLQSDEDLSLSPEELNHFEAMEDEAPVERSRPDYKRASSMKHMNPRNYERDFMRSLNSNSFSNRNSKSSSNLNYSESKPAAFDGHASLRSVRRDLQGARSLNSNSLSDRNSKLSSDLNYSESKPDAFDGHASLRSVRRDLQGARSHSPMPSTGKTRGGRRSGVRDIGDARSTSPSTSSERSDRLKFPTPMPRHQQQLDTPLVRQPSLRSAAMHMAANNQNFNSSATSMWSNTTGRKEEYQHVVELPKGRVLSITEATLELLKILPRNDLKYNLTTYQNSFTGTVGTDTFKEVYNLSREDAEELGKTLGAAKFLHHVCWDHKFKDTGGYFYRLQCEQTPEILNSFCLWQDEKTLTKQVKEIISNIQQKLQLVLDQITDHAKGRIHYSRITKMHEELVVELDYALCELQYVKLARMDKKHLLAFGLNVFQVFLHYAFIKVGIPASSSGQAAFWTELKFDVGGDVYTFSDWWNGICRGNRKGPYGPPPFKGTDARKFLNLPNPVDPRIHFAAGMSHIMRPMFFYSGENLDLELEHAARAYCRKEGLVSLDHVAMTLKLPGGFQPYSTDFARHTRGIPKVFMQWLPGKSKLYIDEAVTIGKKIKVVYGTVGVNCDDWNEYAGDYVVFEKAPFADFKKSLLAVTQQKPEIPKREIKRRGSLKNLLALVSGGDTETGETHGQS